MNKRNLSWALLALLAAACGDDETSSQESQLTYWDDMMPIFEAHCLTCHQEGGGAPFRLDDYAQAKARALSIQAATASRSMPPWDATSDGSCGTFEGSLALSDEQIAKIGAWVRGGAPEGEPRTVTRPLLAALEAPMELATPTFAPVADGGPLTAADEYRCFDITVPRTDTTFITGYEVLPGNPSLVHHIVAFLVPANERPDPNDPRTNGELMRALDAESPDREGWPCYSAAGEGVSPKAVPATWAPGQGVVRYPGASGIPLGPDDRVIVQVHYHLGHSHGGSDSTKLRLQLTPKVENVGFFFLIDPLLATLDNPTPDTLPAGQKSHVYSWRESFGEALSGIRSAKLAGIMPHMHGYGRKYRMNLNKPGAAPQCAMDVQSWDFNWQRMYFYQQPYPIDSLSELEVHCDFDTTAAPGPVLPGWGTENEMCLATVYVTVPIADLPQ